MQKLQQTTSQTGVVFYVTVAVSLTFVAWGVFFTGNIAAVAGTLFSYLVRDLGWLYLVVSPFFLVFVLFLAFSRYGKMRLGKEGEELKFGRFAWFAMLAAERTRELVGAEAQRMTRESSFSVLRESGKLDAGSYG